MVRHFVEFRGRRPGPESEIQDAVAHGISALFAPSLTAELWAACSVPLGAGFPDVVVASYHRQVHALASVDMSDAEILAYLRVVRRARPDTIAERLRTPGQVLQKKLDALVDLEALAVFDGVFALADPWQQILPEIVTVEVKVSNWQRAIEQAARNRIFAHRSFVALPQRTAERVRLHPLFAQLGLGILGVNQGTDVTVLRRPRRRRPVAWMYYYRLASLLAKNCAN